MKNRINDLTLISLYRKYRMMEIGFWRPLQSVMMVEYNFGNENVYILEH